MKVIHMGLAPQAHPMRGACGRCSTILEALRCELQKVDDPREPHPRWYLKCPVCGGHIDFEAIDPDHRRRG
ncbi:MAG: hypothetical protein KF774_17740 [Planctomyces sp.]|nr:hypothetical protein [Planctomyces sp.]